MSAVPDHVHQGSEAWHEYRRTRGNASELPALMGCSPWFPRTPYELWLVKTGRAEVEENEAMRRGSRLEPAGRAYAESVLGEVFEPQVCESGRLSASLDGLTFDGTCLLEIKVPMKGRESETWQHVEEHQAPPAHYLWQVQQQLLCSGAKMARFVVCHAEGEEITDAIHCDVLPDAQMHAAIRAAWTQFFEHLDADTPPPLTDKDVREREDDEWREAAAAWEAAKAKADAAKKALDLARAELIALAGEHKNIGHGVQVYPSFRKGSVDYAAIPELAGVDLDQYRKAASSKPIWTVEATKK